ncbi:hypothetical protein NKJ94_27730 [Mesorhizobium sp. M0060]
MARKGMDGAAHRRRQINFASSNRYTGGIAKRILDWDADPVAKPKLSRLTHHLPGIAVRQAVMGIPPKKRPDPTSAQSNARIMAIVSGSHVAVVPFLRPTVDKDVSIQRSGVLAWQFGDETGCVAVTFDALAQLPNDLGGAGCTVNLRGCFKDLY